jgi:hypothetical protein
MIRLGTDICWGEPDSPSHDSHCRRANVVAFAIAVERSYARDMKKESYKGTSADAGTLPTRTCLLVLGMHRSGTSALTRMLSLLGAGLPKNLMPPVKDNNEAGFWEPQLLATLHDQMLTEAGSRWDDWRTFNPAALPEDRLRHYKAEIVRLISDEFADMPLFVIKDPRVCRFVPLYEEVLAELGVSPLFVHSFRNPLAVIASLGKRDGMTEGFASLLWLRHVLDSEAATRNKPRAFVSYENFLDDWRVAAHDMARALSLEWPRAIEDAAPEIDAHLTRGLQHHAASSVELDRHPEIAGWIKDAYAGLVTLAEGAANAAALAGLERVKTEFDAAAPVFGQAFFPELAARQKRREAEIEALAAAAVEKDALRLELDATGKHLAEAVQENERNAASLAAAAEKRALEERIARMESELAQAQKEALERGQEVANLAQENDFLERQLAELPPIQEELERRRTEVDGLRMQVSSAISERDTARSEELRLQNVVREIYASTSWRMAAPVRTLKQGVIAVARLPQMGRRALSRFAHATWQGLPLSIGSKQRLKNAVFTGMPFMFSGTGAYRAWRSFSAPLPLGSSVVSIPSTGAASESSSVLKPSIVSNRGRNSAAMPR